MPPLPRSMRNIEQPTLPPVRVIGPNDSAPLNYTIINTTSMSIDWSRGLSPFFLGPVKLYGDYVSLRMENAWQYSKVYQCHHEEIQGTHGNIKPEYWEWAQDGWNSRYARRYPMGKGAKPLFSLWDNQKLTYTQARKRIYIPLYSRTVRDTIAYNILQRMYLSGEKLCLWDFDGYDHVRLKVPLERVADDPKRKMGHAFVLAMMLENKLPK